MSEQEKLEEPSNTREYDPGWNDPPMFSYDSRQQYNQVKRPSLTKRVGLTWGAAAPPPQNSCDSNTNNVLPASAPPRGLARGPPPSKGPPPTSGPSPPSVPPPPSGPPPSSGPPMGPPCTPPSGSEHSRVAPPVSKVSVTDLPTTASDSDDLPGSDSLSEINMESVSSALSELADELFKEREREKTELIKRLSLMESQWKDDKFPNDVQEKLSKLAKALKNGRVDEADQLQRGLMVDHSTLCCSWMSAIRKMIAETRLSCDTYM